MRLRKRAAGLALGAAHPLPPRHERAGRVAVRPVRAAARRAGRPGLILPGRMLRGIEVERRAPGEVVQGEDAFVDLIVTNRARGMRLGRRSTTSTWRRRACTSRRSRPASASSWSRRARPRKRGVQEDSVVDAPSAAPFGVAERRRTLGWPAARSCCRPSSPWARCRSSTDASDRAGARTRCRTAGRVPSTWGSASTGRGTACATCTGPRRRGTGTVMVRELEEERTRRLAIVVDTLADVGEDRTPLDACCSAAASVALAARRRTGRPHGRLRAGRLRGPVGRRRRGPLLRRLAALRARRLPLAGRGSRRPRRSGMWTRSSSSSRPGGGTATERSARAIAALAAPRASVVAIPVVVGPEDAKRSLRCGRRGRGVLASPAWPAPTVYPWRAACRSPTRWLALGGGAVTTLRDG